MLRVYHGSMYTHLQERKFYEDIYDRHTVEGARHGMESYDDFFTEFEKKLPKEDKIDRPGNALLLNVFYMSVVGNDLIRRYNEREQYITDWMAKDEAKDAQIASARLSEEPYCHHCGKQGIRIIDKSLMHRKENHKYDDPEEVLIVLSCPHCKKNSAFWEDGTAWKVKPTVCPKCQSEVTHKTTRSKKYITITYTCTSCAYVFKEKLDVSTRKEKEDPDFEKDRVHFCLLDKEFRDKLFEIQRGLKQMAEFGKEMKEKEDNKHIYDAMKELKKPKIAELIPLLSPSLEKAGYIELHLDRPEMGRDVYISFSCLDSKSDRNDYDSRKTLKKLVDAVLRETNWRLMSDGISYRLGYLNGRIRAYENEEDLKKLVKAKLKKGNIRRTTSEPDKNVKDYIVGKDGRRIIL